MIGAVPALLAAVGFAGFQLVNRRALAGVDVYRGTATLLVVSTVVLGLVSLVTGELSLVLEAPMQAILFCAAAGFVHFFFGWTFLGMAQIRVGAARAGIMVGTVPLFGALLAALLLDEALSAFDVAGLLLVVAGVGIVVSARGAPPAGSQGRPVMGVLAGLATAACWSLSPILIRQGLEGLPSPVTGAGVGMAASAVGYGALLLATHRVATRQAVTSRTRQLLLVAGVAVGLSIWMQWTAFDLAPVAVVLTLLQLTPPLVVVLATRLAGEALGPARYRVGIGTAVTVSGSLLLILTG